MFKVEFTSKGKRDLEKLPLDIQKRTIKKIKFFAVQPNPLIFTKPLVNLPPATHRFRVGEYRIAFYLQFGTIFVDRIGHRREVYL